MWLIDSSTLELRKFGTGSAEARPPYATLSHCWFDDDDEVFFQDLLYQHSKAIDRKRGYAKLEAACRLALSMKIGWLWVDTACIDRSSTAELSESINSMYRWYSDSQVNLVFLGDLDGGLDLDQDAERRLRQCKWMRRAWTLQELIAPRDSRFYDSKWTPVGNKQTLLSLLSAVTRVDKLVLEDPTCISAFSMGRRLSWAALRSVRNVEDNAYALLGILGVNMSVLYGEGEQAFVRLQKKAFKNNGDASIFIWESSDGMQYRGPFARSPAEFNHFAYRSETGPLRIRGEARTGCGDLVVKDVFGSYARGPGLVLCMTAGDKRETVSSSAFGIVLREWNGRYVRYNPQLILQLAALPRGPTRKIRIRYDVDPRIAKVIARELAIPPGEPRTTRRNTSGRTKASSEKSSSSSSETSAEVAGSCRSEVDDKHQPAPVLDDGTEDEVQTQIAQSKSKVETAESTGSLKIEQTTPQPWAARIPRRWGSRASFFSRLQRRHHSSRSPSTVSNISRSDSDGSHADSDGEWYIFDSSHEVPKLDPDHKLARYVRPLAQIVREKFVSHVLNGQEPVTAHKRALDDGSASPRSTKRPRTACATSDTRDEVVFCTDSEDETAVVVWTRRASALRFACPFCVLHPAGHRNCLRADLRHIRDVKRHLYTFHLQPDHCPACQSVFATFEAANKHIMSRSCSPRRGAVEGITPDQLRELARRSDPNQSPEEQWISIWDTVFPGYQRPTTPYLVGEVGSVVSSAQDFWSREGPSIISSFLGLHRAHGGDGDDDSDGGGLEALRGAVHDLMIDELLEGVKTDKAPVARRNGRTAALPTTGSSP